MKKLLATIAAFGLVGSASAIEINDNLSINGFIDGSYQYSDGDLVHNFQPLTVIQLTKTNP